MIQLVHLYCGADRGRVNATDPEDLLGFEDFWGHLCQTQVPGCAGTTRESDSRVGPAHVA